MNLMFSNFSSLKELASILAGPVNGLVQLFRHPKSGEYYPVTGANQPSMDKMIVGRSFRTPVRLYAVGDDFQMVVVDHTQDYREAAFRVRCDPLNHDVAIANWKPWPDNPNCLLLELVFIESKVTYSQVFRKVRR